MKREPSELAAVVVNYNSGGALATCVESLYAEGVTELVVVDNCSTDDSLRQAEEGCPALKVLSPGRNLGYGAAANLGVAETASRYVVVCNPDLVVSPGSLEALCGRLEEDESLGLVGPLLRDVNGDVYPSGRDFPGLAEGIGHGFLGLVWGGNPWTRRYRHLGAPQHQSRRADWVSGAFLVARRLAYDSVGGFDEGYFMYVEDVDLCWRLSRAGWKTWYEPAAEVTHEQGRSTSRHPYEMLAWHHLSMWRFATRFASGPERGLLPLMGGALATRLLLAWGAHLLEPVREAVVPKARISGRARGELQS